MKIRLKMITTKPANNRKNKKDPDKDQADKKKPDPPTTQEDDQIHIQRNEFTPDIEDLTRILNDEEYEDETQYIGDEYIISIVHNQQLII